MSVSFLRDRPGSYEDPDALEVALESAPAVRQAFGDLDAATRAHLRRVSDVADGLAAVLELPSATRRAARVAALLHDIGKCLVSRAILRKPGSLDPAELVVLRLHPVHGEAIARSLGDPTILGAIRHHHERLDGSGYPDGMGAAGLDEVTRIVAVADVFDALTSNRPYRAALAPGQALGLMSDLAGTKLDAAMVDALAFLKDCGYSAAA